MHCKIENYKLAWMQGGQMHSTMHPTLAEARKAEAHVPWPRMVMKLSGNDGSGSYAWQLMPGPWADAVRYWPYIAAALVAVVVFLSARR
jgi:hypothetical protein